MDKPTHDEWARAALWALLKNAMDGLEQEIEMESLLVKLARERLGV